MNTDRIQRLLNRSALVFSILTSALVMTACGGSDKKDDVFPDPSSSSSSLSSSSSSSSSSANAVWPGINVTADSPKTLSFSWTPVDGALSYRLYKNADGSSGFVQVGADLTTTSATDTISVHLHDWDNATYYVEACLSEDCTDKTDSNTLTTPGAMLGAIGYFKASNTDTSDWFGWSLDMSADGQTLVVGAPTEDSNATGINGDQASNTSPSAGAVYVFALADGVWTQQAYIKASNTEQPNDDKDLVITNDRFGYRVALSDDGNTLAVTALLEDSAGTGINCDQGNYLVKNTDGKIVPANINVGAVYVFTRDGTTWSQEAYLKPFNLQQEFGYSLALSADGNTLAVGSITESSLISGIPTFSSSSSNPDRCENANATPGSASSSSSSNSSSSSSSSSSTSSSSSSSSIPGGTSSGAVYVFSRAEGIWTQESYIKASNAGPGDIFGASVALSADGNILAVGAPGEDSVSTGVNGNENNDFGLYLVNAQGQPVWTTINSGAVYIFHRLDNTWEQETYLKPNYVSWQLQFGSSLSLSANGNTLAVGAIGDWSRATGINGAPDDLDLPQLNSYYPSAGARLSGAAYIFTSDGQGWQQTTYIKASNAEAQDQFGHRVKLSGDGSRLAVSTIIEAGTSKGINGDESDNTTLNTGAVYVFGVDAGTWTQTSYVKPSNTRGGDRFGASLGLSTDGGTMAVGGYRDPSKATGVNGDQNDDSAPSAGAVYVY
ncbi:FG-GAP repeat protein [Cellvibrio sp. ARAG 10.3]|uniref:FG-GAP repeat protein n=1 Tax=Cellvibrio sp. ARAG 10.3 TaxID=3451358 RepID=UPI003F446A9A